MSSSKRQTFSSETPEYKNDSRSDSVSPINNQSSDYILLDDSEAIASAYNILKEHSKDNFINSHLDPWSELLNPGHVSPSCFEVGTYKCNNPECNFESQVLKPNHRKFHSLTPHKAHAIVKCVVEQIAASGSREPFVIDWSAVAAAANTSISICKDFWWGIDNSLVLNESIGILVQANQKHQTTIKDVYFCELENRARLMAKMEAMHRFS
ncbi:hypothetical protein BdWA1_001548 [Babesia duncani]|uniref:Uncharacterized protein n=1 Tax=Babesia duncani TaxID=323732 RepID=A0AAD9PK43_9APIC|nr:hypothetical protein BdWA1_001548 [Babesia duncani]